MGLIKNELKIAVVTENSLVYGIEKELDGREAIEYMHGNMYDPSVFEAILTECDLDKKAEMQANELNDLMVGYDYVQIVKQ